MVEMVVMVMLRLTSPSRSSVQKFETAPPGQTPITNRPKHCRLSSMSSQAIPKDSCELVKNEPIYRLIMKIYFSKTLNLLCYYENPKDVGFFFFNEQQLTRQRLSYERKVILLRRCL